jgi:hypothetical protein
MKRVFVLGGVVAALATAAPASAQVTLGWDVAGFSSYVWRGLHLSSKPVIQPDAYLTVPLGKASLTAGGWGNVELGKYDPPAIGEGGGAASFDLTEFDWWGEIGIPVGIATITGGATGYIYPNDFGLTKANNTVEVYGKVALDVPLNPKLSVYYDVDKIKGAYIEGSISHGVPLGAATLTVGALAGFSAGQEVNTSKPSELANFSESGHTHLDLSAAVGFSAGPLSITPSLHLVHANDEFTKFTSINKKHDMKLWGGVTISWSKALGAKEEAKE